MAVRIRSLATSGPVVVPLSTGEAVRLSPGQVSAAMHPVVVANNAKVDKLRQRGLIDVETVEEPSAEPADPDASAAASTDQPGQAEAPAGRARPGRPTEKSG